jgi:succinyl-diaminopimelate desuccinylase
VSTKLAVTRRAFDRLRREVERARDEIVAFAADLIRIPTINPPGEGYRECAELLGGRLERFGFDVDYVVAEDRPEHTKEHPRVNVIGRRGDIGARPRVHLNGHIDVVPAGAGWSVDPFGGEVRDGRLYGRGACDMKAGIAAAVYAVECLRRAGIDLAGTAEVSGTVDEESGGYAGVGHLAELGRIGAASTDYVIIPEPLDVDRICVGHRGVYWFEVRAKGRVAHGSMPFLGVNAIERIGRFLDAVRNELEPALRARTTSMPVVPPEARRATININSIHGGQAGQTPQTPCVADSCSAVFDRRFLIEEGFDEARAEIQRLVDRLAEQFPDSTFELEDLMVVHPVQTPSDSPLIHALERSIQTVLGREPAIIASPGTYDQKHIARIGKLEHAVAYGPGILELAHQADEYCEIDDLLRATEVIGLAVLDVMKT